MKLALAYSLAASFMVMLSSAIGEIAPLPEAANPTISAEEQFFAEHPDLKDEGEIVDKASRTLAEEGYRATTLEDASQTLAAQSRALLAKRSPEEWQRKAVDLYPPLGVAGSEFNVLFLKRHRELQSMSPAFTQEPSWPVLLARRCGDELRKGSQHASPPPSPRLRQNKPAAPQPRAYPAPPPESHWRTPLSGVAAGLLLIAAGASLLRKLELRWPHSMAPFARAFFASELLRLQKLRQNRSPGNGAAVWKVALKQTVIVYLIFSLPATLQSSMANSDLGLSDRLIVSTLVGALFGLLVALPFFGLDALWHALHKPASPVQGHY